MPYTEEEIQSQRKIYQKALVELELEDSKDQLLRTNLHKNTIVILKREHY